MGKYLFYDIDGTLIGPSKKVTDKTKWALAKAKENGHKTFLCTGRSPTSISKDLLELNFNGIVCSAGGFVIINGEFIFENFINQYVLSEVMTLFINNQILFTLETKEALYQTPGVNEFFDKRHQEMCKDNLELARFFEMRRRNENRKEIRDFDILTVGVPKIVFIAPVKEKFYAIQSYLEDFFNVVLFSKESDDFINGEIILKHCTKADGIKRVIDYYGASMEDTVGFGDSMNDYQMLEEVNIGVVYENAPGNLRSLAKYYFKNPDDDGIYDVMVEMGLIQEEL